MVIAKNIPASSMKKRVRMRDVATRAGVSISTVSLVLSGDARIPEDTTRKVLQTVKAMEYRPSILARSLAKRGSRTIGVILPESAFKKNQPYYYQVLEGIHAETQLAGYKMLVEAASRVFLERRYYLRLLKEQSADGIIYLAANLQDSFLSEMERENYPFVLLGNRVNGSNLSTVVANESAGAEMATQHLISLGHKAIGHVSGSPETSRGKERENGYRKAMADAGLTVKPEWIVPGNFDTKQAERGASSLVQAKVTAVFAGSDAMALGIIKGLSALNVKVPEQMAVVGMDDLDISSWGKPGLTTVRLDTVQMAVRAARSVLNMLQSPGTPTTALNEVAQPQLIIRDSCGSKN